MTGWRFWAVLLGTGLVLVAVVAVVLPPLFVPDNVAGKDAADLENDVRATLLQGLLGFAFLAAAVGTWRQVQIAERGQITERFKNATDQLGNENPDVRLGGIYSIEQIAKDNPNTYHNLMIEILSAYVRRRSPRADVRRASKGGVYISTTLPERSGEAGTMWRVPVDIQTALTVLGRRKRRPEESRIDFEAADLHAADLSGADLSGADLRADLSAAHLSGADLSRADLSFANLTKADLHDADLSGAKLLQAHLFRTDLLGADLSEANLLWVMHDGTLWPEGFEPPASR